MADFGGQVALVTGASSGIGKAIALELARGGATVYMVARDAQKLGAAAAGAKANEPPRVVRADLTVDADIAALAATVERDSGHLDILVHSAGIIHHGRTSEAPIEQFDAQYRANVRGPYLLTQALLPLLLPRKGQVVFINSSVGLQARATVGQFAATQHAMRAVADALREEVEPEGMRVVSLYPGRTATPRQERIFEHEGRAYRPELLMQPEDIAKMVAHTLELPTTASLTEIKMRPLLKSY